MKGLRVLVCGGRDYDCPAEVFSQLDQLRREQPIVAVITGGARGAGHAAHYWAGKRASIDNLQFKANWTQYGRRAGPIRNQRMIDEGKPNLVLAFPGGKGTADMVRRAKAAGIAVRFYK